MSIRPNHLAGKYCPPLLLICLSVDVASLIKESVRLASCCLFLLGFFWGGGGGVKERWGASFLFIIDSGDSISWSSTNSKKLQGIIKLPFNLIYLIGPSTKLFVFVCELYYAKQNLPRSRRGAVVKVVEHLLVNV